MWEVTRWVDGHNCIGASVDNNNSSITATLIAQVIRHQIEIDVGYKVKSIQADIKKELKVDVSYKKAWYGRRKAIELVFGSWASNFAELPSYVDALIRANSSTIVRYHHDPRSSGTSKIFMYIFWAFGPAIEAFGMCRPVISVDGTHLRGEYKGKLLIAVTQNANNSILPVAFAVVDEETNDSWSWFMEQLRLYVVRDRAPICIISDRHAGITNAMSSMYWAEPRAYHRYCLRHVRSNFCTKFKGAHLRTVCWNLGSKMQMRKWTPLKDHMRQLNRPTWQYLKAIGKERWTQAFDENHRWGVLTTNISESFNNVLKDARHLPIKAMMEMTFASTVRLFETCRNEARRSRYPFPPRIWSKFTKWEKRAAAHQVTTFDRRNGIYKVVTGRRMDCNKGGHNHEVRYLERTCTCGKWQAKRMPCSHAVAVCRARGDDPMLLFDENYTNQRYLEQFGGQFYPIPHRDYWIESAWELRACPTKFIARRAGRIRASRIRNEMDTRDPDAPRRCSNCNQTGHNRKNCPSYRPPQGFS